MKKLIIVLILMMISSALAYNCKAEYYDAIGSNNSKIYTFVCDNNQKIDFMSENNELIYFQRTTNLNADFGNVEISKIEERISIEKTYNYEEAKIYDNFDVLISKEYNSINKLSATNKILNEWKRYKKFLK